MFYVIERYARVASAVGFLDPAIARVFAVGQRLRAARQRIEIIGRVAGRAADGMVTLWHQHGVVMARQHYRINGIAGAVQGRFGVGINALEGEASGLSSL